MKKTNLLELLKEKDEKGYEAFLKSIDVGCVSEDEEYEFFRKAPPGWILAYVKKVFPQPRSERCLIVSSTMSSALDACAEYWGLFPENILWAFKETSQAACQNVLNALKGIVLSEEVEIAMIERRSTNLLKVWLDKFHTLSETGERLLHERQDLLPLKLTYIEHQRQSTAL